MITDVSAFIGDYPFRRLPDTTPEFLLQEMDRVGVAEAWVGHLPSFLYRDPAPGTGQLLRFLGPYRERLHPVPAIHPGLPRWETDLRLAAAEAAAAVRAYPMHQLLDPGGREMSAVVGAAAEVGLPVTLTVRFEDARQRHPLDTAADLPPSAVRALVRADPRAKLLVTHASRDFIEEVHFGLTAEEAERILWDIAWLWGPPHHELDAVVRSVGAERLTFATGMPLRIPDAVRAKLDLATVTPAERRAIESESLRRWCDA